MLTAKQLPRAKSPRKTRSAPPRPVTEILLELAYRLHTTRVVARQDVPCTRSGQASA